MKINLDPPAISWENYHVWGIVTSMTGYRLCSAIARSSGIEFERCDEDYSLMLRNMENPVRYPMYQSLEKEEWSCKALLVAAKSGQPILTEWKQIDFILVVEKEACPALWPESIRQLPGVQFLSPINPLTLKNPENIPIP